MSDVVIRVRDLAKRYRLGTLAPYLAFRDVLADFLKAPIRVRRQAQPSAPRDGQPEHIWALKGVSFEVRQGEVVGVIGPNGAGKTTLLKILGRITRPTQGCAEVRGRLGSLLEVGTGFHPELTGRENVFLSGAILGMKNLEIERKFDEIVAFAELEPFIDTPVKHYSSGMYVRLAFAVAAHLEPDILLVDEVLAVGDAAFQKKCLGKMGDASRQGRTVLFVTHNMSAILNLCSRAYLLEQGRVAAEGLTADVVRRYLESLGSDRVEDLASYRNRQGRGRVRFSRVSFEDERGRAIQQAMSGEALALVLHYQSQSENDLPNCRASIAVEDPLGQPLFVCSTEMISREPLTFPSAGRLRCLIQQLPLSQGRYNLTLFLEVNREIEDWLPSAVSLSVTDGDFFKSGRKYPDGWQGKGVLVPHCWEVVGR